MTAISQIIKTARKNEEISQSMLARKLNVSPQSVSSWEAGRSSFPTKYYTKASKILGVPVKSFAKAYIEAGANKANARLHKALHKRFVVRVMVA